MRRVLPPARYAVWLSSFLPALPSDGSAQLAPDRGHDGPVGRKARPPRRPQPEPGLHARRHRGGPARRRTRGLRRLKAARRAHLASGLAAVTGEHYEGGHWLGTFAVYALTGRGLRGRKVNAGQIAALVAASAGGGIMNALAGGGTLLTFPTLVLLGIPAIEANATSTIALLPGAASSMAGYRREVSAHRAVAEDAPRPEPRRRRARLGPPPPDAGEDVREPGAVPRPLRDAPLPLPDRLGPEGGGERRAPAGRRRRAGPRRRSSSSASPSTAATSVPGSAS